MKIINKICAIGLLTMSVAFCSCDDFFETDPQNIISDKDYIAEENEMYKGFIGILNRMQEAGDQAIFLTDTRAGILETTDNAPVELKSIYNYNETNGNEYADPTCYYAIIVACNDYFKKMEEYHKNVGGMTDIAEENYPALISSAIRIKAWAYLMLGKIYGQAYWFDDPLTEKKPLTDTSVFTLCNMKDLADRAISLLENGMTVDGMHVAGNLDINWYKWLDPETQDETSDPKWKYLTPPAIILNAEFRSWRASYVDESAAQSDWQWIHDNLLQYFYDNLTGVTGADRLTGDQGSSDIFQLNKKMQSDNTGAYFRIFFPKDNEDIGLKSQVLCAIVYDYDNHQRNRIVQYLCPEYPDVESFYLQPSDYGVGIYNETDIRGLTQKWMINTLGGKRCISKYYYGYDFDNRVYKYLSDLPLYKIEPTIPIFRGHDLHFLLAEAETHLGHFEQAYVILNHGTSAEFPDKNLPWETDPAWDQHYEPWVNASAGGYGNLGIAGTANGRMHALPRPTSSDFANYTTDQLKEMYDWAIADEHMKEYVAEGKSYSFMCKVAERYGNSAYRNGNQEKARDSFAVRIGPKYAPTGHQSIVESRIKSNGYFINWQLKDF